MLNTCPRCHDHRWNKTVTGSTIHCPCGYAWPFRKGPLFILSGCSGVGKTTTGMAVMRKSRLVTLDADMFDTSDPDGFWVEELLSLSRNIMQSGATVLFTSAGCVDKLARTYNRQFFSAIHVLALTCDQDELRRRMAEGRAITDEGWLTGSADYNEYFRTHKELAGQPFDTLDVTRITPEDAADAVIAWVKGVLERSSR